MGNKKNKAFKNMYRGKYKKKFQPHRVARTNKENISPPDPAIALDGSRIISLKHLASFVEDVASHSQTCQLRTITFTGETFRDGLASGLSAKCNECSSDITMSTSSTVRGVGGGQRWESNVAAVWGQMATGGGHAHLKEQMSVLGVPVMSKQTFISTESAIDQCWWQSLEESMRQAAEEEKRLAVERGSYHEETPCITVIVDAGWSKRSHKHSYNAKSEALSGLASQEAQHWEDALNEDDMEEIRSHSSPAQGDLDPAMIWEIQRLVGRLIAKADQLLAECWMNIRAKFDGGKQYNRSQRGAWEGRCAGAGLRYNDGLQARNDYARHDGGPEVHEVHQDVPEDFLQGMMMDYYQANVYVAASKSLELESATRNQGAAEEVALNLLQKRSVSPDISIRKSGFVIHPVHHWLGASPDGLVNDPTSADPEGVVEYKNPYSIRMLALQDAASKGKDFCLVQKEGSFQLKRSHSYFYQIQGTMFCTGRKWCDFVLRTEVDLHIERINFDSDFWNVAMHRLRSFYFSAVLPELAVPRLRKGGIREPSEWLHDPESWKRLTESL